MSTQTLVVALSALLLPIVSQCSFERSTLEDRNKATATSTQEDDGFKVNEADPTPPLFPDPDPSDDPFPTPPPRFPLPPGSGAVPACHEFPNRPNVCTTRTPSMKQSCCTNEETCNWDTGECELLPAEPELPPEPPCPSAKNDLRKACRDATDQCNWDLCIGAALDACHDACIVTQQSCTDLAFSKFDQYRNKCGMPGESPEPEPVPTTTPSSY